jgi:hypothetical protein
MLNIMQKKDLESIFHSILSDRGFTKKTGSWYRKTAEALLIVNLQKSSFGNQYYLNLACVPLALSLPDEPYPKENKCPIRIRLSSAFPEKKAEIESLLDLECMALADAERREKIQMLVEDMLLPFMSQMETKDALISAFNAGKFRRAMVYKAAQCWIEDRPSGVRH